ncbi:hypothetical protein F2Q68_00010759 [Brassica cretica]|uniref:Uncharacterized protein n=1 Tax=Brassica cretica TaxID=69181 RepID=A0A8S9KZ76_BRACR|nr:hypothetical protein F2Q68_00010759 [Brassica cretica]
MVWLNRNRSFYEYKIREAQGKTVVAKKDVLQCRDALKAKHSKNQEVSTRKWKPSSSNWRSSRRPKMRRSRSLKLQSLVSVIASRV